MVVVDTVAKRAPRMLHSQQRDPMPIPDVDECETAAGELACQADRDTFAGGTLLHNAQPYRPRAGRVRRRRKPVGVPGNCA